MNNENGIAKKIIIFLLIGVVFFLVVYSALSLNNRSDDPEAQKEKADKTLNKIINEIQVTSSTPRKASIELNDSTLADELPDIKKYPIVEKGSGEINIEIFASPEKSGENYDGWLNQIAKRFNNQNKKINGKTISISIRSISSGIGADYIISGKYLPDAYSPSNVLWARMIESQGGKMTLLKERLAGNVAGFLLSKNAQRIIRDKYNDVNIKTLTEAVGNNEIIMGYTNPLVSSTGMNFLLATLNAYDSNDILSDMAKEGFKKFQTNVPYVAYTTQQMRDSAKSGSLDGLVTEYQVYKNDTDLQADYEFTPFGFRHDNPIYAVGNLSEVKKTALDLFINDCLSDSSQALAKEYGFNELDTYMGSTESYSGNTLQKAQKLWKDNKDSDKEIIAMFVADVSGSMRGEPLNQLKASLKNGAKYISEKHSIGLISYSSNVTLEVPIGKFDLNQRSYFTGAVEDLQADGETATFDALAVAMKKLREEKEKNPAAKCMIFLLSDGETNYGHELNDVKEILHTLSIPVYTIGYNANIDALKTISQINEAVSINADSEDVIYQLKNLFNAQM